MDEQLSFADKFVSQPLPARLRPQSIEEVVGQQHLLGEGKVLRRIIQQDAVSSMIFWGPPGVGKTTLAQVIANHTQAKFINFSAVTSGIKEIREVMREAEENRRFGEKTIVFVDEIHRFNKAQQDAFLPFVEKGSIILIGATTENPSFEVNGALLSRCKVFVLKALEEEALTGLLKRALASHKGFGGQHVDIPEEVLRLIANFANGDARTALSTLEMAVLNGEVEGTSITVTREVVEQCTSRKSMRNSDPDAAVYWLARMLEAVEDPLYIARRVLRFASEDVGLADPRALEIAVAAYQACHFIGMPECTVHLTQVVVYLSVAPKSNALYLAYQGAKKDALTQLSDPVPLHIRNGVTKLMREVGYGAGYQYAHDAEEKLTDMRCLPDSLLEREYYLPTTQGLEGRFKDRLEQIKAWKKKQKET